MSRVLEVFVLAAALSWVSGCEGAKPPASKSEASQPAAEQQPAAAKPTDGPSRTPAVVVESEGPAPTELAATVPTWFDAGKFEGATVTKQMASEGKIAGGQATAMVLELAAGTTPQQCIDEAREVLGESLPQVPEASSADGRLTLQGKTEGYHYTVVCGDANGKPTMYMSYTAQQ